MTISTDLRTFLLADATLSGLIGTRLYPVRLPQTQQKPTVPALVYTTITGRRHHAATGAVGLADPRIQFDIWDDTFMGMEAVFEALRKRLDGYRGAAGSGRIQGGFLDTARDLYDGDIDLYRRTVDFIVWHEEATT